MHRQLVDDVGPVAASPVAVADQLRADRVTVCLVADQDVAEVFACRAAKGAEQVSKVGVLVA
jgi:hypothetical protein